MGEFLVSIMLCKNLNVFLALSDKFALGEYEKLKQLSHGSQRPGNELDKLKIHE